MKILGISSLDTDCTACLLVDGKIISSIAEERLSRIKLHAGFPSASIEMILKENGLTPKDIDVVAYAFLPWTTEAAKISSCYVDNLFYNLFCNDTIKSKFYHMAYYTQWSYSAIMDHRKYHHELMDNLKRMRLDHKLIRVEHHLTHAAAAHCSSGFANALIVTLDAYGSGLAGSVSIGTPDGIKRVHNIKYPHSMGLFYSQVTEALGFRPVRHEGKIVGLAAFGDDKVLFDEVYSRCDTSHSTYKYVSAWDMKYCRELAKHYKREDIAAAYQAVLERVITDMVSGYLKKYNMKNICLAGGVTANVKLNQRIFEIDGVENIFIFPNMGDGGTGAGAALWAYHEKNNNKLGPYPIEHVYFGPEYSDKEIKQALDKEGLEFEYMENIEPEIAKLLSNDKVVARFNGRMEYGPRSLGNRSILYPAKDPAVNNWLNKRLARTEFMPFAPATLYEYREKCYINIKGAEHTSKFMTITFDCTDYMKKISPAAVHVDGTARPQLVTEEINPS
ncbi:MAG: carbamoyltransferase, partial [Nitrospirae bacterium]|nr:carbamoyltransferase [Nitrospirota bacterium]